MRNLAFVIWMIGYPIARVCEQMGDFYIGLTFSDDVRGLAAIMSMGIWIAVGLKLYEGHNSETGKESPTGEKD